MNTAGLIGGTAASLGIGYIISGTGSYDIPVVVLALQLFIGAFFAFSLRLKNSSD
jgi:hypothetical protein